jgi:hypothetical protein
MAVVVKPVVVPKSVSFQKITTPVQQGGSGDLGNTFDTLFTNMFEGIRSDVLTPAAQNPVFAFGSLFREGYEELQRVTPYIVAAIILILVMVVSVYAFVK